MIADILISLSFLFSNGSRLSGVLIVALNLYLRARIEQEVDIVLDLKLARRNRPQFIADYVSTLMSINIPR